jgi:hypothetical protein
MRLTETLSTPPRIRPQNRSKGKAYSILLVLFLLLGAGPLSAAAQPAQGTAPADGMAPSEVVWLMVARNETRARELKYFTALRHYHLEFHGWGRGMAADMHVQVTYSADSGKSFQVVDKSGSRFLLNHVLTKLLETEQDDSRQQKAALTPFNYNFTFEQEASEGGQRVYVFSVEPKKRNKLLYRGRIWIDARDYAVVRVEAQPAENPSFWIKSTEIRHTYEKDGDFWLPQSNRSESQVRLGGTALLTIDYGVYQFEKARDLTSGANELASRKPLQDAR